MTIRAKTTTAIVLPGCRVGRTGHLDAHEGDRMELDPEDAKGLVEHGLVHLAKEEQR
jgi:hypothetical protein